jgi:zinc protease
VKTTGTATTTARGLSPVRSVLPSGTVVIVQETSTTPAVTINATLKAGGLYEPTDRVGVAYMTGRVLDRGTEQRSADVISEELDDRGVTIRVTTSRHTMVVTCTCLSEDFDAVLALVLDVIRRPVFPEEEFVRRRAECLTSLRQDEDNPSVRAVESLFELLYGAGHPYGRPSKGTVESVAAMTRADLAAFHALRFHPDALTLAIVGDVTREHAIGRTALELDGWSGSAPPDIDVPSPASDGHRIRRDIAMPGKAQADIAYGFVAIRRADPRYDAYWVMNNIFGQFALGGRLGDNIRERQGMAYYAFSAFDPSIGEGPLIVRAGVDPGNVERALEAIDLEVRSLGSNGATADELAQTQQYLIGSIPRMLETNSGIASFLQQEELFNLGLDYDRRLAGLLRSVTLEQVRAAAADVLHPERARLVVAGPPPGETAPLSDQ